MKLTDYVGRRFVIKGSRYGALDGLIGTVKGTTLIPSELEDREALVVETASEDFPVAIMTPENFESEVLNDSRITARINR